MASSQDGTNLLATLRQLYSRMMALHTESHASNSLNKGNMGKSRDIVSPLSKHIDKLAATAVKKAAGAPNSAYTETEHHSHYHSDFNPGSSAKTEQGELSSHLKNSHKYSATPLNMGDKLVQSTWEHFHAAIRLARQGDVYAAKLHAELTNNALNEAAHFLSDSVYARLSQDVTEALQDIDEQIKGS